jgi:hypothetical protein
MEIITRKQAKEQGLKTYFTGKPCPRGEIAPRYTSNGGCSCRACTDYRNNSTVEIKQRWYQENKAVHQAKGKAWRENNAELKKEQDRAYYQANKEKVKERAVAWARANPGKKKASRQQWAANNPDTVKQLRNNFYQNNYGTNPQYTLSVRLRTDMRTSFKSVASGTGRVASAKLLGTSWAAAAEHLSSLFPEGMSWENYGDWHVDHIRPCASFDQACPEQQAACWNWRNLQPLWAAENIAKSDSWTPAMEAEWVQNMIALGWEGDLFLAFAQAVAA